MDFALVGSCHTASTRVTVAPSKEQPVLQGDVGLAVLEQLTPQSSCPQRFASPHVQGKLAGAADCQSLG
jgi:hypothetical protein